MGLPHSGETSDANVFSMVERTLLTHKCRILHGILLYHRFKDDGIIVARGLPSKTTVPFINLMKKLAQYYEIKAEWSATSVDFLELTIQRDGNRLTAQHYLKPSALRPSLSTRSSHAPHVHAAWPRAQVKRISKLCSTKTLLRTSMERVLSRLHDSLASILTINVTDRCISKLDVPEWSPSQKPRRTWVVLGFHPPAGHFEEGC